MLYTTNSKLSIYNVTTKNLEDKIEFTTEVTAVDKDVLLNVANLGYGTMLTKYRHLTGIKMNENQTKATFPIRHLRCKRLHKDQDSRKTSNRTDSTQCYSEQLQLTPMKNFVALMYWDCQIHIIKANLMT